MDQECGAARTFKKRIVVFNLGIGMKQPKALVLLGILLDYVTW